MILPAELRHKEQIIELWKNAFGDNTEDIRKYLDTIFKYFFVYEEDDIVKGMLSVLPVSFCDKNGGYIYAVTTHSQYRGQGICNKLMEYVKADRLYDFLVLKPQNEGLFDFYEKMGFKKVPCLSKKESFVENLQNDYQLKELTVQEYEESRNQYFGEGIIKWNSAMLSFAKDMYAGEFYAVEKNEKRVGLAFLYKEKNTAIIKELLSKEEKNISNFIAGSLRCQKAEVTCFDSKGTDGFMIYPEFSNKVYFNIYFD